MPKCTLRDGYELDFVELGAGAPLLLVHGWAANATFFADIAQHFAKSHRVVAPTLRGHAGAGGGTEPLTIATLGKDIAELIDKLKLGGAVGVGWSMGAMALWATPGIADRLAGLVVEDMGPRLVNDAGWPSGLSGGYSQADIDATVADIRADWPAYVKRLAPRMFAPSARTKAPELIDWAAREMAKVDGEAMAQLWGSMAAQDFRSALSGLALPMLVVHGADSQIYPDGATAFVAQTAPRAQRLVISGAGHVPHLEAQSAFFEHVEAFARAARRREFSAGGPTP